MPKKKQQEKNDAWVDDALIKKMKIYDLAKTCMLQNDSFFSGVKNCKNKQDKKAVCEYILSKLVELFDKIPNPLIMHNKEFKITRANQAYLNLIGKSNELMVQNIPMT